MRRAPKHILACLFGAFALTCSMLLAAPVSARADTLEELEAKADELGGKVNEAAEAYAKAIANVEVLDGSIAENEARIAEVEAEIPEQRARSASAIRALYKMSQNGNGLLELIVSSDDFNSFISTITYLNAIEQKNTEEARKLVDLQNDLTYARAQLQDQREEAEEQRAAADDALKQAEALRQEAVKLAARKAAEEAAREQARALAGSADTQALADAVRNSAPQNQPKAQQPQEEQPSAPSTAPDPNAPEQGGDRAEFVEEWTQRIDEYLAGSPLEGYGYAFAEAAYDYGVDPRWSPAISNTESSKGRHCFLPYNAWGWSQTSWPDWDTAIRAHIAGLSAGYGYTISEANAQKYCPPTWQDWYAATLSEMAKI